MVSIEIRMICVDRLSRLTNEPNWVFLIELYDFYYWLEPYFSINHNSQNPNKYIHTFKQCILNYIHGYIYFKLLLITQMFAFVRNVIYNIITLLVISRATINFKNPSNCVSGSGGIRPNMTSLFAQVWSSSFLLFVCSSTTNTFGSMSQNYINKAI